jgi:hypothetical protein
VALFGYKVNLLHVANIFVEDLGNIGLAVISKDVGNVEADILNGGHILISLMQFCCLGQVPLIMIQISISIFFNLAQSDRNQNFIKIVEFYLLKIRH